MLARQIDDERAKLERSTGCINASMKSSRGACIDLVQSSGRGNVPTFGYYKGSRYIELIQFSSNSTRTKPYGLTSRNRTRKKNLLNRFDDTAIVRVKVGREHGGVELSRLPIVLVQNVVTCKPEGSRLACLQEGNEH